MNKLTFSLTPQEVNILVNVLGYVLTGTDINNLKRKFKVDYLIMACLHEIFNKLDAKNKDLMAFGYKPGKTVRLTLKRHEAIALFLLCSGTSTTAAGFHLPALPNETIDFMSTITGQIHKHYFV